MNMRRVKDDFKYIIINHIVCKMPSWRMRRFFLRKFGMKIGDGARVGIGCIVIHPEKITIGDRTIINEYCHLDGRGGLVIGNDTSISVYCKIITASHKGNSGLFEYYDKKTIIGNRVWIGCGATILDGTTINDKCIIGAGAVLKGLTETRGIYLGVPALLKKYRDLENDYSISYEAYFR